MGNCGQKIKQGLNVFHKKQNGSSPIGEPSVCPNCQQQFGVKTTFNELNVHLDQCVNGMSMNNEIVSNANPNIPDQINTIQNNNNNQINSRNAQQLDALNNIPQIQKPSENKTLKKKVVQPSFQENFYWIKVPTNEQKTQWTWERRKAKAVDIQKIRNLPSEQVKKLDFNQKYEWFRYHLEKLRIPWQMGADWVSIYPDNVLLTSMQAIQNCNLHKEIKVKIEGEKVQDAGGILREWVHLIIKESFHQNTGMFIMAETEDVTYRINPEADTDEHVLECFKLFGKIIGKAVFEKVPLTIFLDHTILKHILGQKVTLDDIFFFDKQLYNSWYYIKNNSFSEEDFYETFAIYKRKFGGGTETIELIPNGEQTVVNNENKNEFIDLSIKYLTETQIKPFLEAVSQSFYKVIPKDLISVFEVHELETILNSTPFINIEDWKIHTKYDAGYKQTSQQIKWFWESLQTFDQPKLGEFLRYCTGSSRTPIEGFKKLESNRGEYAQFTIRKIQFSKKNPFPIAHTCFNRLELPEYQSYEETLMYLKAVVSNDLDGVFGME